MEQSPAIPSGDRPIGGGRAIAARQPVLAAPTSAFGAWFPKIVLLAASLLVVGLIANSILAPAFMVLFSSTAYAVLWTADRLIKTGRHRAVFAYSFLSVVFSSLLLANVNGWIGTLTGTDASLDGQLVFAVGVSFYALHAAGIIIDTMTQAIKFPSFLAFVLSICSIFNVYSGPLEKAGFVEQMSSFRLSWDTARIQEGLGWIVLGLFMKYTISDPLVFLVDLDATDPVLAIVSALIFELRVYFNFAGYSFIVYGAAACLGLRLTLNFVHPLFATDVQTFWQRWHVSLGRWFHRYFYRPLRDLFPREALLVTALPPLTFLVSAAWHGVTVNFLIWGLFHGSCYWVYVNVLRGRAWSRLAGWVSMILVLIVARLLFIDADTGRLLAKLQNLASVDAWLGDLSNLSAPVAKIAGLPFVHDGLLALALATLFLVVEGISHKRHPDKPYYLFRQSIVTMVLFAAFLLLTRETDAGFVYARQ